MTCCRCGRDRYDERRLRGGLCLRCRTLELVGGWAEGLSGHARRVTMLALLVADELRVAARTRGEVELGGLLHDCGKTRIPVSILDKRGPLDDEERAIMRTHVTEGERLAAELEDLPREVPWIVRASHERWDGLGYPDGLRGEQIPLAARIVSVADAYDAMTSSRSYRRSPLPIELAVDVVVEHAGTQFDPAVAQALVCAVERSRPELSAEAVATAFEETLRRLQGEQRGAQRFRRESDAPQLSSRATRDS